MTDHERTEEPSHPLNERQAVKIRCAAAAAARLPSNEDTNLASGETAKKLTADEQMALFEKALKEDDWGHQPC